MIQSQRGFQALKAAYAQSWTCFLAVLITAAMLIPQQTEAQTWQYVYGPNDDVERGYSRVTPVKFNCGAIQSSTTPGIAVDGYIAVGTSYSRDANGDIYVVRVKNDGTTEWEYQYDIFSNNSEDVGRSIAELSNGTGFVITGWTRTPSGDQDVVVLHIDCNGAVFWSRTIGSRMSDDIGYDIIETTTGDPTQSPPSNPMDLVIAGGSRVLGTNPHWDGYLIRMNRSGGLIWDKAYDQLQHDQIFYGLTELRSSLAYPQVVGDIVAVGSHWHDFTSNLQGYAVRVSGANGLITPGTKHGAAHYGGCAAVCGDDVFYSVTELLNPAENDDPQGQPYMGDQDVVIAGYSDSPGDKEIYMVKLDGGNLCIVETDILMGNSTGQNFDDVAHMIYENPTGFTTQGSPAQFDLLLTGYADFAATASIERDMIFQSISPVNLAPIAPISKRFGKSGDGRIEDGWSLHQVQTNGTTKTNGYILCGSSDSDPFNQGDPGDLYLVKTDATGNSGTTTCERDYHPFDYGYDAPVNCVTPTIRVPNTMLTPFTMKYSETTDLEACSQDAEKRVVPGTNSDLPDLSESHLSPVVAPNVASSGKNVRVTLQSTERAPVTMILSNELGEVLHRDDMTISPGTAEVLIQTGDLAKGIYFIAIHRGEHSWMEPVVIQ